MRARRETARCAETFHNRSKTASAFARDLNKDDAVPTAQAPLMQPEPAGQMVDDVIEAPPVRSTLTRPGDAPTVANLGCCAARCRTSFLSPAHTGSCTHQSSRPACDHMAISTQIGRSNVSATCCGKRSMGQAPSPASKALGNFRSRYQQLKRSPSRYEPRTHSWWWPPSRRAARLLEARS